MAGKEADCRRLLLLALVAEVSSASVRSSEGEDEEEEEEEEDTMYLTDLVLSFVLSALRGALRPLPSPPAGVARCLTPATCSPTGSTQLQSNPERTINEQGVASELRSRST